MTEFEKLQITLLGQMTAGIGLLLSAPLFTLHADQKHKDAVTEWQNRQVEMLAMVRDSDGGSEPAIVAAVDSPEFATPLAPPDPVPLQELGGQG